MLLIFVWLCVFKDIGSNFYMYLNMNIYVLCFNLMRVIVLCVSLIFDYYQGLERCYVEWRQIEFYNIVFYDQKLWFLLVVMSERVLYLEVLGNRRIILGRVG